MRSTTLIITLFLLFGVVLISAQSPLASVISNLAKYQTSQGGFSNSIEDALPTAEATQSALFITSFFNLDGRIDVASASQFLQSLRRNDGGYASSPSEASSSVPATHAAVSGLLTLGLPVDEASIQGFLRSTLTSSGFASPRPNEPTSLEATVAWFELAEAVNHLQSDQAQAAAASIKNYLADRDTDEDGAIFFDNNQVAELTPVAFNALAIRLGKLVSYEFGQESLKKWAAYFNNLQHKSGCFMDGPDAESFGFAATAHSLRALYTLQQISVSSGSLAKTDLRSLQQCASSSATNSLTGVADAYRTLAVSNFFGHFFTLKPAFEVDGQRLLSDGESIVQGSQILPILQVTTEFGIQPHLEVEALIEAGESKSELDLVFDQNSFGYRATKPFDTSAAIGSATISFVVLHKLPLVGTISFARRESKLIGFGIEVDSHAIHSESEHQLVPGSVVTSGTTFLFNVKLYSVAVPSITSGAFTVHMKVADAAGSLLDSEAIDGEATAEGFQFHYALNRGDLPPGVLSFDFSVESHGRRGSHTHARVAYQIETVLAASDIEISSTSLTVGQTLSVSFEPVIVLDTGASIPMGSDGDHSFYLDIKSQSGVIQSLEGVASNDRVSFSFTVPADVAYFSNNLALAFRFHPASGSDSVLTQIDNTGAEATPLSIAVQTELTVIDVVSPLASYEFGSHIEWTFTLKDSLSGREILPSHSRAAIFVSLSHGQNDDAFLSAKLLARASGNDLSASLPVSANSIAGSATLSVDVFNADGAKLAIAGPSSRPVTIAGALHADSKSHSTALITPEKAAFIVEFSLTSGTTPLFSSELHAFVLRGGKLVSSLSHLPVAATKTGYSVSWTLPIDDAPSGDYEVKIVRTHEYRHFIQLLNDYEAASQRVHPIVTIVHHHTTPVRSYIGIPTEYLVICLFAYFAYRAFTTYSSNKLKKN